MLRKNQVPSLGVRMRHKETPQETSIFQLPSLSETAAQGKLTHTTGERLKS